MTAAADLAALARDNRHGMAGLDATLRAIEPAPMTDDRAILALSRVYAARMARAACGAAMLACAALLAFAIWNPLAWDTYDRHSWIVGQLLSFDLGAVVKRLVIVGVATAIVARWLAARRFHAATRDTARERVESLASRAYGLALAGYTSASLVVVAGACVFGTHAHWLGDSRGSRPQLIHAALAGHLAIVVVAVMAGAIVLAGSRQLARRIGQPRVAQIAVVLLILTWVCARAFDHGWFAVTTVMWRVSYTLAGTAETFALAVAIVGWLHRREETIR